MDKKFVFAFWILFIAIYSTNLTLLPIFEDEAQYLLLVEEINDHPIKNIFIYPQNGLFPMFGWLAAIFNIVIQDSLIAGRIVNVFLASSLIWWISAIRRLYGLPGRFSLVAILLLITSPVLLLNARVALLDTAVLVLTAWYLYFVLKIFLCPARKDYVGLFITLLAALLTKATVLFGIPAVVIFILIEGYQGKMVSKNVIWLSVVCVLAFIISGGLFLSFSQQIGRDSGSSVAAYFTVENFINRIKLNSWLTLHWITIYYQPALIALLEYLVFFKHINYRKLYLMLGLWVVTAMVMTVALNKFYYPRHILILLAPLVIFVAGILVSIPKLVSIPLFILIILPRIFFDWNIMITPQKASFAAEDRFSFYEDYTSGVGVNEIADTVRGLSKDKKIIVWLDGSYILRYGLPRELRGNSNVVFKSFNPFIGSFLNAPGTVVKDNHIETYAIANRWYPSNTGELNLIKTFPVSFRHVRYLYQAR